MHVLVVSDKVSKEIYDNFNRSNYGPVDMIISCGDLPNYYMNFLIDAFNVPCFYVPGNHDQQFTQEKPAGWVCLHKKIVKHKGLVLAGIGGSPFYNGESPYQYTENQIFWKCFKLSMQLMWNKPIDIFVTHSPAFGLGDIAGSHVHKGFKSYNRFIIRHKPKLFVYGHIHLNYGVQRLNLFGDTLLVNGFNFYNVDFDNLDQIKSKIPEANIHENISKL